MRRRIATLAAVFALAAPTTARARSDQYTPGGAPIRWHRASLPFVIDPSATDAALPRPVDVLGRAVGAWRGIGHAPTYELVAGSLGPPGYDPVRRENNVSGIAVYRSGFPVRLERPVLAITLVTRDNATGEILDADVLVDAWRNRYAALGPEGISGDRNAPNDWQNVLTHEIGHTLGLVEDPAHATATMFPSSLPGEVGKRDLDEADRASIAGAYAVAMNGTGPVYPGGCGGARVAPLRRGGAGLAFIALAFLGAAAWRARRRGGYAFAACGGIFLVLAVPTPQPEPARVAEVRRVDTRIEGGVFVTRAVVVEDGRERAVEVPGGRMGDLVQQVFDAPSGEALTPGARVDANALPSAP